MPRLFTAPTATIIVALLLLNTLVTVQGFTVNRRSGVAVHLRSGFTPLGYDSRKDVEILSRTPLVKTQNRCTKRWRSTKLHMVAAAAASKSHGGNLLVGNLASNLSKFWISPKKAKAIKSAISQTVHVNEIALIAFCSWALVPIFRFIHNLHYPEDNFTDSYYYKIPQVIGQAAQIGGIVYAVDVLTVVLGVLGIKVPKDFNVCTAMIMYLLWGAYRLARFKRYLIEKRGKAGILNTIGNGVIAIVAALGVLDILSVETGLAVQSLFAFGSAGTLIVSLGSQNLASQIVNGLAIASTGMFYENEKVVIGSERVIGTVQRIGLMATDIRRSDEKIMSIPNQQLAGQRVGNITRCKRSSVKQTVWFSYDDIHEISQVCSDIKACIMERCPKLETEIRPFRATLRDFKRDHLEVGIQANFKIPPYSNEYFENRQQVMYAIADAAKKNGVQFDIPSLTVRGGADGFVGRMAAELNTDQMQATQLASRGS